MNERVVQAERIELVDKNGAPRAILACDHETGAPTLTFKDSEGKTRITIGIAWNDMPSVQLNESDGTARVALVARPEGHGLVLVVDAQGNKEILTPP